MQKLFFVVFVFCLFVFYKEGFNTSTDLSHVLYNLRTLLSELCKHISDVIFRERWWRKTFFHFSILKHSFAGSSFKQKIPKHSVRSPWNT